MVGLYYSKFTIFLAQEEIKLYIINLFLDPKELQ